MSIQRSILGPVALLAALVLAIPTQARADCFSLYDAKNKLVYRSPMAPVDTSRPLSEETQRLYPGHFLIVEQGEQCVQEGALPASASAARAVSRVGTTAEPSFWLKSEMPPAVSLDDRDEADVLHFPPTSAGRRSSAGTDVRVRSYVKKDGTFVRSHTRAAPGRGRGR